MKTRMIQDGRRCAVAVLTAALFAVLPPAALAQSDVSILFHESLVLLDVGTADDGSTDRIVFDAFGRRFTILVEESAPGVSGPAVELIRARLADTPDSWARLTKRGDVLAGLIHDRDETYVIESRNAIAGTLMVADTGEKTPSIIYRLSDTLVAPGLLSCDTRETGEPIDGKAGFAQLTAELSEAAASDADRARIGVIADSRLHDRLGEETGATVEQMLLTVGGIYEEQVGVVVEAESVLFSTTVAEDPVSSERNSAALLEEVSRWRMANQGDLAITHLITNRELQNADKTMIAGISYLGSPRRSGICDPRTGASISEWIGGAGLTALVMAHEIGHNFGAPHDGEAADPGATLNPCANVPPDVYLMSPRLQGTRTDEFGQCSIEQMERVIAAAACLRPAAQKEAGLSGDGSAAVHWLFVVIVAALAWVRRARHITPENETRLCKRAAT